MENKNFGNKKQKLSLIISLLMSVSVFGNVSENQDTIHDVVLDESQKNKKFGATVEVSGRKGNKRSIGELDVMLPVFETEETLGLIDVKAKLDNYKSKEINIGAAARRNFNDSVILGLYTYFDHRKTGNNFSISGATIGVEALTRYLDARANFYVSQGKKKKIVHNNKKQIELKGKSLYTLVGGHTYEQGFSGYDIELGLPLFSFSEELDKKIGTKLFAARYQFTAKGAPKISGTRFRLEQPLGSFDVGNNELRMALHAETQNDNIRKRQSSIGFSARLHFNSSKENYNFRSRMMDTIVRDVDIVTAVEKKADTIASFVDSKTGKKIDQIIYVGNASDDYIGDGTKEKPYSIKQVEAMNVDTSIIVPTIIKGQKPLTKEQYNDLSHNPLVLTKGKGVELNSAETESVLHIDANTLRGVTMHSSISVIDANTGQKVTAKEPKSEGVLSSKIASETTVLNSAGKQEEVAVLVDHITFAETEASVGKDSAVEIKSDKEFIQVAVKDLDVKVEEVRELVRELEVSSRDLSSSNTASATKDDFSEILLVAEESIRTREADERAAREVAERARLALAEEVERAARLAAREREEQERANRLARERARVVEEPRVIEAPDEGEARVENDQERAARLAARERQEADERTAREAAERRVAELLANEDVREALEEVDNHGQRNLAIQIFTENNGRFTINQAINLATLREEQRNLAIQINRDNPRILVNQAIMLSRQRAEVRRVAIQMLSDNPNLDAFAAMRDASREVSNRELAANQNLDNQQPAPDRQDVIVDNILEQDIDLTQYIKNLGVDLSQEQINLINQNDQEEFGTILSGVQRDDLDEKDKEFYDLISAVKDIIVRDTDVKNVYNLRKQNYERAVNIAASIQDEIEAIKNDPDNDPVPDFAQIRINNRIGDLIDTMLIDQDITGNNATMIKDFMERITQYKKNEVAEMRGNFMNAHNTSADITSAESVQRLSELYGVLDGGKAIDILKKILIKKINQEVKKPSGGVISEADILGLSEENSGHVYRDALANRNIEGNLDIMHQERESGFSIVNKYIAAYRRLYALRNEETCIYTEEINGRFNIKEALAYSLYGALDVKEAKRQLIMRGNTENYQDNRKIFDLQKDNINSFWDPIRDMQRTYNDKEILNYLDDGKKDANSCPHGQCVRASGLLVARHSRVDVRKVSPMMLDDAFVADFEQIVNKLGPEVKDAVVRFNRSIVENNDGQINISIDDTTKKVIIKDVNNNDLPKLYNNVFSTIINEDLKPRFRFVNDDQERPLMQQNLAIDVLKILPIAVNRKFQY